MSNSSNICQKAKFIRSPKGKIHATSHGFPPFDAGLPREVLQNSGPSKGDRDFDLARASRVTTVGSATSHPASGTSQPSVEPSYAYICIKYIYMYVCMYVCKYIYIHKYHAYIQTNIYIYMCVFICTICGISPVHTAWVLFHT